MMPYTPPRDSSDGFNCPFCKAYSHQKWGDGQTIIDASHANVPNVKFALCTKCDKYSIWHSYKMIFPLSGDAPLPHEDIPYEIKQDYEESSNLVVISPRSSAALLRLAIEKLTDYILDKEKGKDLNDNIRKLVEKGLPITIQQSLDILRVIGNNALHPGQIDMKDNRDIALKLFELVNLITDYMITKPKQTSSLYQSLPEDARKAIEKRDSNS